MIAIRRSLAALALLSLLLPPAVAAPWTFVSIPDFLNADIGDISGLATYDGGRNSTTPEYEVAIDFVLDSIAAESPDFVLVAGDLVQGHWHRDVDGRQIFGPTNNLANKRAAVNAAADHYYPIWKQRFDDRGLTVHAALGDHDVGDNNWPVNWDKSRLVPDYRAAFGRNITQDAVGDHIYAERPVGTPYEGTAYAIQHDNTLVVTVDVFRFDDAGTQLDPTRGTVRLTVDGDQLTWLDGVLTSASADPTVDHIIVQGHTPVLGPVRAQNSSNMVMPGQENTEFWKTLERHGVDLYFAGEVHHMAASNFGGVEQVAHGGILGYAPNVNYLVGTVDGDRIDLELKWIQTENTGDRLWQTGSNRPYEFPAMLEPAFQTAGTLTIDKSSGETVYSNRTGFFEWYGTLPEGLLVNLPLDDAPGSPIAVNVGPTGAANDGILDASWNAVPDFEAGIIGGSLKLEASVDPDVVTAGPTPVTGSTPRTTSVWLRTDEQTGLMTLLTFGVNASGGKWDLDIDATNGGVLELGVGNGRTNGIGTPSLNDGLWHHVAAVLPEGGSVLNDVLLYVDGQPIAVNGTNRAIDTRSGGSLFLGRFANSVGQGFTGWLDDPAIWSRPLSDADILALYNLGEEAALGYGALSVEQMLVAFAEGEGVVLDDVPWYYWPARLPGADGEVVNFGDGRYSVNLGGGAGMATFTPEPASALLLGLGALVIARRRRET
jgi:hypothetical protein